MQNKKVLNSGNTDVPETEISAVAEKSIPQVEKKYSQLKENSEKYRMWAHNERPILSNVQVLLVEDNPVHASLAAELLIKNGYKVDVAKNGHEAVSAIASSEAGFYQLVLMDIAMPDMNGYEATKAIRALDHPDADLLPIVALSANNEPDDIRKSIESGMNEHIGKPFSIKQIQGITRNYLR